MQQLCAAVKSMHRNFRRPPIFLLRPFTGSYTLTTVRESVGLPITSVPLAELRCAQGDSAKAEVAGVAIGWSAGDCLPQGAPIVRRRSSPVRALSHAKRPERGWGVFHDGLLSGRSALFPAQCGGSNRRQSAFGPVAG